LRRSPKGIATICEAGTRRSAQDIQSFGADIARRVSKNIDENIDKNIEMSGDSPQRSPKATSRLFSNPWGPDTQAKPRNIPPNATTVTPTRALSHLLGESQSQWWRDTIIWPFGLRNSAMTSR
jgi:hypothetical protein